MADFLVLLSVQEVPLDLGFVEGSLVFENVSHVFHLREIVGIELGGFQHRELLDLSEGEGGRSDRVAENPVVDAALNIVGMSSVPGDRFDGFVKVFERVAAEDGFPRAFVGLSDDLVSFFLGQLLVSPGVLECHTDEIGVLRVDGWYL